MTVAIVIGHTQHSPGARYLDTQIHEWHWCSILAADLKGELGTLARVYRRPEGSYSHAMDRLCAQINHDGPQLVVSLHFNAASEAYRGQWSGGCALHWPGSSAGEHAARVLSAAAARAIGNRDRGPKAQAESWSGLPLLILRSTKAPAVILEPFYGDHREDAEAATEARVTGRLARSLAAAIMEWR